ncbi:HD domain-containing protein [Exiguobacterium aestuarii]|uniref:HD domain-containing protein n=1 Tax=Exiguobacterium aestuarii TaxID=273527 RepID=A0ABW2PM77_9BACL|nr:MULTISPECIES: HD domain-containing protein [Exiguobacterium]MCT4785686.1 HD domain-containing protein [Exiguobacterium aestuarii]
MEMIQTTKQFVEQIHENDHSGHDSAHIERVVRLVERLMEDEPVDKTVLILAAYLHDVEDHKLGRPKGLVKQHLNAIDITDEQANLVLTLIDEVSFSKGREPTTRESEILQDADRLDAIGAIGIARTFQFAGSRGTPLDLSEESAIQHFHDKLLKLASMMHTAKAKQLAMSRHAFMERFLMQFHEEWDGGDN